MSASAAATARHKLEPLIDQDCAGAALVSLEAGGPEWMRAAVIELLDEGAVATAETAAIGGPTRRARGRRSSPDDASVRASRTAGAHTLQR